VTQPAAVWAEVQGRLTQTEFCTVVGISRTTLWRQVHPRPRVTDPMAPVARALPVWRSLAEDLCVQHPTYGHRLIHAHLRRAGYAVGRHTVRRWMRVTGRAQSGPIRDTGRTIGATPAEPTGPNQAWQLDATKLWTTEDGWLWQTSILDVFDRRIVAHVVRKTCRQEEAQDVLALALDAAFGEARPTGLCLIHDRGSQFTGWSFRTMLQELHIRDVVTAVRHPQSCGRLERWHRTLKEECLWWQEWTTLGEVQGAVATYVRHYNEERLHSALGYRTPLEVYRQAIAEQSSLPTAA
jgi:putative transposase